MSNSHEIKATSGFVFSLCCRPVAWKFVKQTIIARSTIQAEFVALDVTSREAEWLRELLSDIPFLGRPILVVFIHCDN